MRNKTVFITISLVIVFLIAVAVYTNYAPDQEGQIIEKDENETAEESISIPETTAEKTSITLPQATSPSSTATVEDKEETTAEEEQSGSLPTISLDIFEGPVIVDSNLCYYRVEARVTGDPYPSIRFSKDDSNGAWGRNKAQVNLENGQSYELVATATNSAGSITRRIQLSWPQ